MINLGLQSSKIRKYKKTFWNGILVALLKNVFHPMRNLGRSHWIDHVVHLDINSEGSKTILEHKVSAIAKDNFC